MLWQKPLSTIRLCFSSLRQFLYGIYGLMRTSSHAHICHKWMRGFRLSRKAQAEKTKKNTNRWLPPSEFWVWNFEFWFILGFACVFELFNLELAVLTGIHIFLTRRHEHRFHPINSKWAIHNAPWRTIQNSKLKIPNSDALPSDTIFAFLMLNTMSSAHHKIYGAKFSSFERFELIR